MILVGCSLLAIDHHSSVNLSIHSFYKTFLLIIKELSLFCFVLFIYISFYKYLVSWFVEFHIHLCQGLNDGQWTNLLYILFLIFWSLCYDFWYLFLIQGQICLVNLWNILFFSKDYCQLIIQYYVYSVISNSIH